MFKNIKVNGKDYPIYEMENNQCSKPPTSTIWDIHYGIIWDIDNQQIISASSETSWKTWI